MCSPKKGVRTGFLEELYKLKENDNEDKNSIEENWKTELKIEFTPL